MLHELVEHIVAGSPPPGVTDLLHVAEVRKLLSKHERAIRDPCPDILKLLASPAEIRLGWNASERGPVSNSVQLEFGRQSTVGSSWYSLRQSVRVVVRVRLACRSGISQH